LIGQGTLLSAQLIERIKFGNLERMLIHASLITFLLCMPDYEYIIIILNNDNNNEYIIIINRYICNVD